MKRLDNICKAIARSGADSRFEPLFQLADIWIFPVLKAPKMAWVRIPSPFETKGARGMNPVPGTLGDRDKNWLYGLGMQLCILLVMVLSSQAMAQQNGGSVSTQMPNSVKYKVVYQDALHTPSTDIIAVDLGREIYLITKAKRSQIGKEATQLSTLENYRLYKVVNRNGDWYKPKITKMQNHFGDTLFAVGYTVEDSNRLAFIAEAVPQSTDARIGEKEYTKLARIRPVRGVMPDLATYFDQRINPRDYYTSCHPVLHPNGKLLVFVSNRPAYSDTISRGDRKAIDGLNLFYSLKDGDVWSVPIPFDSLINSLGDEILPSFTSSGELYFASNGRGGLGKYDIFKAEIDFEKLNNDTAQGKWKSAIHLPEGINSEADDYGMIWNKDLGGNRQSGYFSTTRLGNGDADIYSFVFESTDICGTIVSQGSAESIPFADLVLVTQDRRREYLKADAQGQFRIPVKLSQYFQLVISAPHFLKHDTLNINTFGMPQGGDKELGAISLKPLHQNQLTISGTIVNPNGRPILEDPNVLIHSSDSLSDDASVRSRKQSFEVTMPVTGTYYLDVSLSDGSKNTWHFVPNKVQSQDTIHLPMVLTPLIDSIATFDTQYAHPRQTQDRPIANLVWYDAATGEPRLVGHEQGDSAGRLRIAIPSTKMANCSLVVAQKGYVPEVYNLARESAPQNIELTSLQDLRFHPITIFHPYNMSIQDTSVISARNLERIAQLMLFDSTAVLQVISFTDSRGSSAYNDKLSAQRASYIADYILGRTGIPAERLKPEGLGERNLLNECDDSHPCPDSLHRMNRRTEITLYPIELKK